MDDWRTGTTYVRTGLGLNAWSMRARGWLTEDRIGKATQDVVLRPLHRPALAGCLAAEIGPFLVELRIPDRWDSGVGQPCVLVHASADGQTYLMTAAGGSHQELRVGDRVVVGDLQVEVRHLDAEALVATVRLTRRAAKPLPTGAPDRLVA